MKRCSNLLLFYHSIASLILRYIIRPLIFHKKPAIKSLHQETVGGRGFVKYTDRIDYKRFY